jgi:alpha-glucosidase
MPSQPNRTAHLAAICVQLAALIASAELPAARAVECRVEAVTQELRQRHDLNPFYDRILEDNGLIFVSSGRVSDYALMEAAYLIEHMLAENKSVREAIIRAKVRLVVMSSTERTTDIPEHAHLRPAAYWDRRARGLGWSAGAPVVSCAEENLLNFAGDPYDGENILIHEFAHAVHEVAAARLSKDFDDRLNEAYRNAMKQSLWKGTYAATNRNEYWAEGSQSWFDANPPARFQYNDIDTRNEIKQYDPHLAALLKEVYGDGQWRYVRSDRRDNPAHLAEYRRDAQNTFAWDKRGNE